MEGSTKKEVAELANLGGKSAARLNFYNQSGEEVGAFFRVSSEKGLSVEQVVSRQEIYGKNELAAQKKPSRLGIFLRQFNSFIIYILIFAVLFSIILGEIVEAVVILGIIIVAAGLGFWQEMNADSALNSLNKMAALHARVKRNGETVSVDARELVPGDIILLEEGDKIPADARLLKTVQFETLESSLTGESMPVSKGINVLDGQPPLAERSNMVFSGTIVTRGRAVAIVTAIGMKTEIGSIAGMLQEFSQESTPLQKNLESFGRKIGVVVIVIALSLFILGVTKEGLWTLLLSGQFSDFFRGALDFFTVAVSLAVAAVPEGLPAIVTITLAIGVTKMVSRQALVRRISSVETLGSTTVICTDKTGTLTKNEMTVKEIFTDGSILKIGGEGYSSKGDLSGERTAAHNLLFRIGALCNNASFSPESERVSGDPTEIALLVSAWKAGIDYRSEQSKWERDSEEPFSSERKMMSVVCRHPETGHPVVFVKGAPEAILSRCNRIILNGEIVNLDRVMKEKIWAQNKEFASRALRVLGFAYKRYLGDERFESDLIFVGLQGMIDPPRPEVKDAIVRCKSAGMRVIIITGDNRHTAEAIARDVGITGRSMDGIMFEGLSEQQQMKALDTVGVFSRVEPRHKMRIVELLQKRGEIVAVTGDGVNDAPALKKANIGVAMGIKGTDVAKEASDMVLLDDNFASVVNAVEEGRGVYANIHKFVNYLLSSNLAEVMIISLAILLNLELPLTAIMLLWINLVTDGLPALALSKDSYPRGIMKMPPRNPKEGIMNKSMVFSVIYVAIVITAGALYLLSWASGEYALLEDGSRTVYIQTVVFAGLVVMELARLYAVRSEYNVPMISNKWLMFAVFSSVALLFLAIYTPLSGLLGLASLDLQSWRMILIVGAGSFVLTLVGMFVKKLLIR